MIDEEYVEFTIPYLLEVEDSIEGNVDWRFHLELHETQGELRFQKEMANRYEYSAYLRGDRSGNYCRTRVQVRFPDGLRNSGKQAESGPLIEAARDFLNRFLEVYRALVGDVWVRHLALEEIVKFDVHWITDSGEECQSFWVPNETFSELRVDAELRDKIQHYFDEGLDINPAKKIDFDTQEKIDRGEYELAVINADRLVEFWAINVYVFLRESRGASLEEAIELVKDSKFTNVAANFFRDHLDFDFQSTEGYSEWKENTHELRNHVVHEGWHVNEEEAVEAHVSAKKAIAEILTEFEDELKRTNLFAEVTRG